MSHWSEIVDDADLDTFNQDVQNTYLYARRALEFGTRMTYKTAYRVSNDVPYNTCANNPGYHFTYYNHNKEKIQKYNRDKYRELSEEGKQAIRDKNRIRYYQKKYPDESYNNILAKYINK